jgi:hypothetical protein
MFVAGVPVSRALLTLFFLLQLREKENQGGAAASPEGSTSSTGSSESGEDGSGVGSSSSDGGNDGEQAPEREEDSPKVDITN